MVSALRRKHDIIYIDTHQFVLFLPSPSYSGAATPPTGVIKHRGRVFGSSSLVIAQEVSRFWCKHAILHFCFPSILVNVSIVMSYSFFRLRRFCPIYYNQDAKWSFVLVWLFLLRTGEISIVSSLQFHFHIILLFLLITFIFLPVFLSK